MPLTVGDLKVLILLLAVSVIVGAIAAQILGTIRETQTSGTYEYNVSTKGLDALKNIGDWFPTIGIVIAAAVVIGLVSWFGGGR